MVWGKVTQARGGWFLKKEQRFLKAQKNAHLALASLRGVIEIDCGLETLIDKRQLVRLLLCRVCRVLLWYPISLMIGSSR